MNDYKNVLAYVDERPESQVALVQAAAMARSAGTKASIIDVIEALNDLTRWPEGDDLESLRTLLSDSRKEILRLQSDKVGLRDAKVTVTFGKASHEIIRQVLRGGHDLVIKVARGRKDGRRILFGSVGMHLVRKCPVPVWLVQPGAHSSPRRILAAVNPVGEGREQMCKKILEHANALAAKWGAELHVLHSWNPTAEAILRDRLGALSVADYVHRTHTTAARALETLLEQTRTKLAPAQVHLEMGSPVDTIVNVVREQMIDVVVMGSVGRSGQAGQLIGHVTEEILMRVDCGVFCIKPEDFVCPIALD